MKHIAPAGTPVKFYDIVSAIYKSILPVNNIENFKEEIRDRYDIKYCFFTSTGRAALSLILKGLHRLSGNPERNEVIIPAYTCYSVAASVIRAGFKLRVCDVDPTTLSYNIDKLASFDFSNVFSVVTANLYGIPNELDKISEITEKNNVYLIDDAAQCLDGIVNNRYSGTYGDVGLFSLDKGKNITSMEGGIIVTNSDELADILSTEINRLGRPKATVTLKNFLKLIIYILLINPRLYWIPNKLPFLGLGKTLYTTKFNLEPYSKFLASIGLALFKRIDHITATRINNAEYLIKSLKGLSGINIPLWHIGIKPVFARLPILVNNPRLRKALINELNNNGFGATVSYPNAIVDISDIQSELNSDDTNTIGGRTIAGQIITLPTHHYVTNNDIDKMVSIVADTISNGS